MQNFTTIPLSPLRNAGVVCAGMVGAFGLYASTHGARMLDLPAAVFCVAATGMAAFVTCNLGAMAQQMLDRALERRRGRSLRAAAGELNPDG
ncbi:MAG: hypothetical protein KGM42_02920 [Hyphomicrobiales bacterium]|nr:hypothetical protein [Hyphomicrobiales bacterium]